MTTTLLLECESSITSFQATEERRHMAAFWEMYRWPLHAILTDQNDGAAGIFAARLVTMHVNNVLYVDVQRILPVGAFVHGRLGFIVAVHQLVRCPFDDQRVNGLVEAQIARHWLAHILLQLNTTIEWG